MKYYLVALFDAESYAEIEKVQRNICQKFKLYRNVPTLHVILETVEDPDIDKLSRVVADILKPYKRFKVETNGIVSFDPSYKSVNLKLENKGYLIRLARTINDTLKLHGFNVKEITDNWNLHVSLASTNYTVKDLASKDYIAASSNSRKNGFYNLSRIDRIELWKSVSNKKEMLVKSFPLKDF